MPSSPPSRLASARQTPGLVERVRRIWEYRELLASLVRRELKVRYKNSVLGFVWTLLNPLLYLAVFSLVFTGFLRNTVPQYGLFLLSGLLAWNLFSTGLTGATTSIVGNGSLVQKVWFPREVLPLAAIGASIVNFGFQLIVLASGLVVFGRSPDWGMLWIVIPAFLVIVIYMVGLGLMLSALNVYFRDVQHFLELALLAWFWLTPIVYQYDFLGDRLVDRFGNEWLALLNPMVPVVVAMQRAIYNPTQEMGTEAESYFDLLVGHDLSWFLASLGVSAAAGLVICLLGLRVFSRLEANLGEEL